MQQSMRAMILDGPAPIETRPLKLRSVDGPVIHSGDELLVEIEACGVCRSHLHLIEGDWKDYGVPSNLPIIPGHEIVGAVRKIGDRVRTVRIGDRVGIQPLYSSCLKCEYCAEGRENLCESSEIIGETVQGGYAEFICAKEDFVTSIPDTLDSQHAAPLFCPGITAYKAVMAAKHEKGKSIGIFGVGGVGHLAIQIARLYGSRVVAVSRGMNHLDLARKLGAENVLVLQEAQDQFLNQLRQDEGRPLDSAIVLAPSDEAIDTAIKSVKKGGTIVLRVLGNVRDFPTFEEKIIKGSVIGTRKDMAEVIKIAGHSSPNVVIVTFELEKANEVLGMLKNSQILARAVLVP